MSIPDLCLGTYLQMCCIGCTRSVVWMPFRALPVLQLLSPVTHPWVNTYMQVVGHPDLHGWDGTNPPLIGDIVAAVIQEFGRSNGGVTTSGRDQASTSWGGPISQQPPGFSGAPPAPAAFGLGNPPVSHPTIGARGGATSAHGHTNVKSTAKRTGHEVQTKKTRPPVHQTPIPDIPDAFSELQGLSTEKLTRLLGDESARQALLLGMTNVVGMKDLRTDVRKGNVETARLTLAKQDEASALRKEGEEIKAELKALQTSYEGMPLHSHVTKRGNKVVTNTIRSVLEKRYGRETLASCAFSCQA